MVDDRSGAIRALQDVRKMRRAISLRTSTDIDANSIVLDTILKEAIMARQVLGSSRLGKNATNEIKNIRNDLIAGTISVGDKTKEYITKYSTVYNEILNIDKEEKKESTASTVKQAKETVRSIIPDRQLVTSALMAANPIVGYGFKVGSSLLSGMGKSSNSQSNKKLQNLLGSNEEGLSVTERDAPSNFSSDEVLSKLDLIYEELHNIREPVNRLDKTTEEASRLQRLSSQELELTSREEGLSAYGQGSGVVRTDSKGNELSSQISQGIASAVGANGLNGENSRADRVQDVATGSLLGRLLMGGTALAGIKVAAVAGMGYLLYSYRDEIIQMFKDADIGKSSTGFGGSESIRQSVQETANSIQNMDDYVNALPVMTSLLEDEANKREDLNNLESEWERLLEQSNEEMENQGFISSETSSKMMDLNTQIQNLEESLEELTRSIRETRIEERRNYQSSRQTEGQAISTGSSEEQGLWDRILQQESGNRQFDENGNTIVGPNTKYGRAVGASQLLEATAQEEAARMGIEYSRDRLFNDEDYNKMIGQSYFNRQLRRFDGDPVLASIAYNSGPGNAERLVREFGNPARGDISHDDFLRQIEQTYPSNSPNSWARQTVPYARNTGMRTLSDISSSTMEQQRSTQSPQSDNGNVNQMVVNNNNNVSSQNRMSPVGASQNNEPTWRQLSNYNFSLGNL